MRVPKLSLITCLAVLLLLAIPNSSRAQDCYVTGDLNCSGGEPDFGDLAGFMQFFTDSFTLPRCPEQMDVNGDCVVDWRDYVFFMNCLENPLAPCLGVWTCCDPVIIYSCCVEGVGDANGSGGEWYTIGDISAMIDAKFITGTCDGILPCLQEADFNQSGGCNPTCDDITISDISWMIDALFGSPPPGGYPKPNCLECP
jgi:hypothetical protein